MFEKEGFKTVVQSDGYVKESGIYCQGFNSVPCEMSFLSSLSLMLHGFYMVGGGGNNSKGPFFMLNYKCTIRVLSIRPFQQRKLRFPGSRFGPRAPSRRSEGLRSGSRVHRSLAQDPAGNPGRGLPSEGDVAARGAVTMPRSPPSPPPARAPDL